MSEELLRIAVALERIADSMEEDREALDRVADGLESAVEPIRTRTPEYSEY